MKLILQPLTTLLSLVSLVGTAAKGTIIEPYDTATFPTPSPGTWANCFTGQSEYDFDYLISTEETSSRVAGAVTLQGMSGGKLKFCRTAYMGTHEFLKATNYGSGPVEATHVQVARGDPGKPVTLGAHECTPVSVPPKMTLQVLSKEVKRTQIQVNNGPVSFVVTIDPAAGDLYDSGVQLTHDDYLEYLVCALDQTTTVYINVDYAEKA